MPDEQQPLTIKQQRDLKQELKEQRRQQAARRERTKTIATWSIVGLTVAAVVALIIVGRNGANVTGQLAAVTAEDHVEGKTDAPAVLIEYSDYQCPACGAYYPVVKDLQKKYGEKLTLVYRNFPLTALHQYAQIGAQAAEAAGLQGKYWEMHDLLFENQNSWSKLGSESDVKKTFADYAGQLKLDTKKFSSDLTSSAVSTRVDRDVQSGNAVGVNATPTFYLNGKKLTNPAGIDPFSKLIDEAIAAK